MLTLLFSILGFILKIIYYLLGIISLYLIIIFTRKGLSKRFCTCKTDLSGKVILVTGGNTGLGLATAKILAKHGARIVIASRNVAKSKEAAREIVEASGNPNVDYKTLDLSKLSSVKRFADDFHKSYDRLDVLINNSGMNERHPTFTEDRINTIFQVNHVAPVYLTQLLLNKVIASKPSRIIFVASGSHFMHRFDPNDITGQRELGVMFQYATTKFLNILTSRAMSKVLPEGVTVNSLHPGMANTDVWDVEGLYYLKKFIFWFIDNFWRTREECAQTIVHLAMAPSLATVTGKYFNVLKVVKTFRPLDDDEADKLYKDTLELIEDRVKRFD